MTHFETIAEVDTQIVMARWRVWHGVWERNSEQVESAKKAIDVLLDRRYELMPAGSVAA